jgi:protoporphyrinogen oxidase
MPKNIAIIGSGFLGLTVAKRLIERGERVTIFEAADRIGGLAAAWNIGGIEWDKHYHVTLASDSFTRRIVEEIGLGSEFRWVETKTGFYTDGQLYSMSNALEFLRFPPLDIVSKVRLAATILYASRLEDWKALESVSVESWLRKLAGRKTFEKIWKPLLRAKLGDSYREVSAAFIWATIQRMYAARNSGMKKEMFGYVRGGYARVLERFGEHLSDHGVDIRLNSPAATVVKMGSGKFFVDNPLARRRDDPKPMSFAQGVKYAAVATNVVPVAGFSSGFLSEPSLPSYRRAQSEENVFDQVIVTCPSGAAAKMCPQLSDYEKRMLEDISYQGIVCASLLTRRPLSKFYVTNITDEMPFTAVIEMSAMVDRKDFGNNSLVYLPKYVSPDDPLFEKSDNEIEEVFLRGLERMHPAFRKDDVLEFKVSRVRSVFPLPTIDYSSRLPSTRTSIDGLFVLNSSHIVNGTLNVNETVALAERFAAELV